MSKLHPQGRRGQGGPRLSCIRRGPLLVPGTHKLFPTSIPPCLLFPKPETLFCRLPHSWFFLPPIEAFTEMSRTPRASPDHPSEGGPSVFLGQSSLHSIDHNYFSASYLCLSCPIQHKFPEGWSYICLVGGVGRGRGRRKGQEKKEGKEEVGREGKENGRRMDIWGLRFIGSKAGFLNLSIIAI